MKLLQSLIIILLVTELAGCSVIMAMRQPSNPNFLGADRGVVEAQLGSPVSTQQMSDRVVATYRCQILHPSTGRAVVWGVLDFFTGFVSEVITTPVELWIMPTDKLLQVTYTKDNTVKSLQMF